jgi:hypothetical protein
LQLVPTHQNMKKVVVLFLACIIFSNIAHAMSDTVRYGDSCYLFKEVHSDFMADYEPAYGMAGYHPYNLNPFNSTYAKLCTANVALPVYGVAVTMFPRPADDTITSWYTAYLYRDYDTYFELIDSSTAYSDRNWFLYSATRDGQLYEEYVPSYEFYFKQHNNMEGTFAVEVRRKIHGSGSDTIGVYFSLNAMTTNRDDSEPFFNPLTHIVAIQYGWWGMVFPIIQPERIECEAALAEVMERGDDYAVLKWDMEGDSCQLSVVPYNQPVDSATVVDLTDSSYTATGLSTGIYYAARLRTQCHHRCHIHTDTVVWSDWGAPTLFYVGDQEPDTGGVGIRQAEPLPEVSLTPNPAHRSATVRCEEGIKSVELLTVKGERILYQNMSGEQACTLDLTGLAKGIYIVQITTPQGTATRKLAVE